MPVTRSQLHEDYVKSENAQLNNHIDKMFFHICNEVNTSNLYGFKTYTKDVKYTQFWKKEYTDKVIEKLKAHFTDSIINSINDTIYIDWTLPTENITTSVQDEKEENIEINITLPSRISTRASSKK